jgi:hypothetical protein
MKTSRTKYESVRDWSHKGSILQVVRALQKRNFTAFYLPSISSVQRRLLNTIPKSATIGIGGSVTVREIGIIDFLKKRGTTVFHHWGKGLTEETDKEVRRQEGCADYYLTSANAITRGGDIINIDGIGNRIAITRPDCSRL